MEAHSSTHRMTDIHMHVLPGADDGSYDLPMSEFLLKMAYAQGVRAVFATPHSYAFELYPDEIRDGFCALRACAEALPFEMRLFLGCEVRCSPGRMGETLEALRSGALPPLNGTRHVLTEFSTRVTPSEALSMARRLLCDGWTPVIAHVERYPGLFDGCVEELARAGCLFQVNAYSLDDESDDGVRGRARRMLREGMISFLGSDAHRLDHRPPSVKRGLAYLYAHCSEADADAVAFGNAERLLIAQPAREAESN